MQRYLLGRALACFVSFAIAIAFLSASASLASAQPRDPSRRVVVERFRGPRAGRLHAQLVANLEENGWTVIDEEIVWRITRELGMVTPETPQDYIRLGAELRVAAFLSGTVTRARRSWRLVVRVRNAGTGDEVGSESWGGRTTSAMSGVARTGAERLAPYLTTTSIPSAAPRTTTTPTRTATTPVVQRETQPQTPPLRPEQYAISPGMDDEVPTHHVDEEGEEEDDEEARRAAGRFDSFRISLSAGALWRSTAAQATVYAVRRGQTVADPATTLHDETRGYTSSGIGHAELGVEAELYPGALGDQAFPWLGALVSFRHSAFLSSIGCRRSAATCTGDGRIEIGTDQLDVQAGLRGRIRAGDRRGDFQVMIEALWGMSSFALDPAQLRLIDFDAIVPPAEHQYVSFGGGFEFAPIPDGLVLAVRADYRLGLVIGERTKEVWGLATQPANGLLAGAEIRHEATWVAEGAFVALRFEYFQFQTQFRGQVGCATPGGCPGAPPGEQYRDENLWELWPVDADNKVVGGIHEPVVDHYVRWGVYLGYAFR